MTNKTLVEKVVTEGDNFFLVREGMSEEVIAGIDTEIGKICGKEMYL